MQEVYYNTGKGDRFGLNAWFLTSKRGLSQTTVDYGDPKDILHQQRERTLRSVLSWDHLRPTYKVGAKAGYIHTWLGYDYARDKGNGEWAYMITSRSKVNTLFASGNSEFYVGKNGFSRPTLPCTSISRKIRIATSSPSRATRRWSVTTKPARNYLLI